jgi:hypothetical protein
MNRIAIKYAFILLIITIIWTLIEHVLGYNTTKHEIGQYTRLIIAFVYYAFVALVIVRVRKQKRGSLTFAKGLKAGTITALTYGFLVTGWYALYAEVINKQFQPTLLAFERHRLEAEHATPEQIADKLKDVEMQSGGSVTSYLFLFVFMFLFGFAVAVIASLIFKRKNAKAY